MIRITYTADKLVPVDSDAMMAKVRDILVAAVAKNFAVGGRPTWQAKRDGSPSYLRATDNLARSIHGNSGGTWAEVVGGGTGYGRAHQFGANIPLQPRAASSLVGSRERRMYSGSRAFFWYMWYATKDPKWKYMALTRNPSLRLPARPWMTITEEDKANIATAVKNNLFRVIRNF